MAAMAIWASEIASEVCDWDAPCGARVSIHLDPNRNRLAVRVRDVWGRKATSYFYPDEKAEDVRKRLDDVMGEQSWPARSPAP